jgi:hypothetical protein
MNVLGEKEGKKVGKKVMEEIPVVEELELVEWRREHNRVDWSVGPPHPH